jgi:hypothetical protein
MLLIDIALEEIHCLGILGGAGVKGGGGYECVCVSECVHLTLVDAGSKFEMTLHICPTT